MSPTPISVTALRVRASTDPADGGSPLITVAGAPALCVDEVRRGLRGAGDHPHPPITLTTSQVGRLRALWGAEADWIGRRLDDRSVPGYSGRRHWLQVAATRLDP